MRNAIALQLLRRFPILTHNVGSLQPLRLQELSVAYRSIAIGGLAGCQLLREWIDQMLRKCAFRRVQLILTDANTGLGKIGNMQVNDECVGQYDNGHENENGENLHSLMQMHSLGALNTHYKVGATYIGHPGATTIDYIFAPASLIPDATCRLWLSSARWTRKSKYFFDHIPIVGCFQLPCPGHGSAVRSCCSWPTLCRCLQEGQGGGGFLQDLQDNLEKYQEEFAEVRTDPSPARYMHLLVAVARQAAPKNFSLGQERPEWCRLATRRGLDLLAALGASKRSAFRRDATGAAGKEAKHLTKLLHKHIRRVRLHQDRDLQQQMRDGMPSVVLLICIQLLDVVLIGGLEPV
ncbi:unnamed protein product, partial [Prorocentrum cordatum]